ATHARESSATIAGPEWLTSETAPPRRCCWPRRPRGMVLGRRAARRQPEAWTRNAGHTSARADNSVGHPGVGRWWRSRTALSASSVKRSTPEYWRGFQRLPEEKFFRGDGTIECRGVTTVTHGSPDALKPEVRRPRPTTQGRDISRIESRARRSEISRDLYTLHNPPSPAVGPAEAPRVLDTFRLRPRLPQFSSRGRSRSAAHLLNHDKERGSRHRAGERACRPCPYRRAAPHCRGP